MDKVEMDMQGAKILLVDDTQTNLDVLCKLLEAEGYKVALAPNGQTALRIAGRVRPDLILLDVMMPGMNGFEVCHRLKQDPTTQRIPVIFVTGQAETEAVVEGFRAGGIDYIVKPFQSEEVLARVQTHLKIDRLARQLEASNRQIREATERKSRFLASMSHELRTPLTAIKGSTDNLLDGLSGPLNDRQVRYLNRIDSNADHLLNLINDILDLSKVEAGRMEVKPVRFKVRNLIASCCEAVNPLVRPGVALNYEVSDGVGEAHTDEARLRQIVTNLLSNALKFTDSGEIRVSVWPSPRQAGPATPLPGQGSRPHGSDRLGGAGEGKTSATSRGEGLSTIDRSPEDKILEIAVSDMGIGIPSEALGYIFEEFRQVEGSHQRQKGTGLGLAITKRLTGLLGGTIGVESEVGKGSTFTVRIPMVYGKDDPSDPAHP